MNRRDLFERILASLHAEVLNDAQWRATAALIDELCGVKGIHLVFGDGEPAEDIDTFFAQFRYLQTVSRDLQLTGGASTVPHRHHFVGAFMNQHTSHDSTSIP